MSEKIYPLLSGSLRDALTNVIKQHDDPIAKEIIAADSIIETRNRLVSRWGGYDEIEKTIPIIDKEINSLITTAARAITIRPGTFEVTYTPEGKELLYNSNGNWNPKDRQSGKPTRLFRKLVKKEFKEYPYEKFNNRLRAEVQNFGEFKVVEGKDITKYYSEDTYCACTSTLGASCMRYPELGDKRFFEVYEENAKMLVLFKDDKILGRAILWEDDYGRTFMDRVYVCKDYLVNTFEEYAKSQKWYVREHQALMESDEMLWYSPEDNYEELAYYDITIYLPRTYSKMPYMDTVRYYDADRNYITTNYSDDYEQLCSTEGYYSNAFEIRECMFCMKEGSDREILHWTDANGGGYICEDCGRFLRGEGVWVPKTFPTVNVHVGDEIQEFTEFYVNAAKVPSTVQIQNYRPFRRYFMLINGEFYLYSPNSIIWNEGTNQYELQY